MIIGEIIGNPDGILGGIAGDVFGSIYEGHGAMAGDPEKIDLYNPKCHFTDDSILQVATMDALLTDRNYGRAYKEWGRRYPNAGYGKMFKQWLNSDDMEPYGSYGNGAAGWAGGVVLRRY